ncbi:substrate-binding protein [Leuconostoc mesenteroides]
MKLLHSILLKIALSMGVIMYLAYAIPTSQYTNRYLIGTSIFTALFLPIFTFVSTYLEQQTFRLTASMFASKFAKFVWQSLYNLFALGLLIKGHVIDETNLRMVGGLVGAVCLTSLASQGLQYLAIMMSNHAKGNRFANIFLALSFNVIISALAAIGYTKIQIIFIILGLLLGTIGIFISLITDIWGLIPSKGGVGLFLGTFNPVHKSHIAILKQFINERQLDKVYIHPTVIPKMHQYLLDKGMIEIVKEEAGKRYYEKSASADPLVNFFPTGKVFYEAENRVYMLKTAIEEAGLAKKVEILFEPQLYQDDGFYAIIKIIRQKHPHMRLHGLLGTDEGGMLLHDIYDETGVKPYVVLRRDNISGTAIRKGAQGMTMPKVTEVLNFLTNFKEGHSGILLGKKVNIINNRLEVVDD